MSDLSLSTCLILGLCTGMQHSLEPDHIVAVTAMACINTHPMQVVKTGVRWALGHSMSLMGVALLVIALKLPLPAATDRVFDILLGLMLLALGGWVLWRWRVTKLNHSATCAHSHPHPHEGPQVRHGLRSFLIGCLHGMAGSGALVVLISAAMPTVALSLTYLVVFCGGIVLGMAGLCATLSLKFRLADRWGRMAHDVLQVASGVGSVGVGLRLLGGL